MIQLSQIPEGGLHNRWQTRVPGPYPSADAGGADECERLCLEADHLLEQSRVQEDQGDLEAAFNLCQSAAQRSRAAMDAPYNNPQTLVFARMKHNTCVMRGRSLHRRLLQSRQLASGGSGGSCYPEGSIQNGVAVLPSIDEPRHSRQNSRDSNRSIRTSAAPESTTSTQPGSVGKNIEIYATLPKKKGKKAADMLRLEAAESNHSGRNEQQPAAERQSRSSGMMAGLMAGAMMRRERAKSEERNKSKPVPIPSVGQDDLDIMTGGDGSSGDNSSRSPGKKQHRIRRRLLMGGLIKRKNRSLPDLRADDDDEGLPDQQQPDEVEGDYQSGMYPAPTEDLNCGNPNLEKSKLMTRKNNFIHSSLNRNGIQSPNKVPPPPPVRKTSHLTPLPNSTHPYDCYAESQITVRADIHHERTLSDLGGHPHDLLPPYPVVEHVRQASDDFPPPPPPQELQMLTCDPESVRNDENRPIPAEEDYCAEEPSGLLAALQRKRKEILGNGSIPSAPPAPTPAPLNPASANTHPSNQWLRELQNTLQTKKMAAVASAAAVPPPSAVRQDETDSVNNKSVRKLASRFEQVKLLATPSVDVVDHAPSTRSVTQQPAVPAATPSVAVPVGILDRKRRSGEGQTKKKSVTFCDQVILVSTAEDTEQDETYVPNPILQRVLRSAFQQEMVKDGLRQEPTSAPAPLVAPNFNNGSDEVDRPVLRSQQAPYQKLPVNSQMFQQHQQHYQPPPPQQQQHYQQQQQQQQQQQRNGYGIPPSPMMGQRIGPPANVGAPPSYAPPPQYPHHARNRFQPQMPVINNNNSNNNNNNNNNNTMMKPPNYPQPDQGRPWPSSNNGGGYCPCSLCGKKQVPSTYQYCSDCQFYMQRFQPKV